MSDRARTWEEIIEDWTERFDKAVEKEEYAIISRDLCAGLRRYVLEGVPTGGFLRGCLANDLSEAVGRADLRSLGALRKIVTLIHMELPADSWNSHAAVKAWVKHKGFSGKERA